MSEAATHPSTVEALAKPAEADLPGQLFAVVMTKAQTFRQGARTYTTPANQVTMLRIMPPNKTAEYIRLHPDERLVPDPGNEFHIGMVLTLT